MVSDWSFMIIHGSMSFFFHDSRLVLWFFMVSGGFCMVPGLVFMIPGGILSLLIVPGWFNFELSAVGAK